MAQISAQVQAFIKDHLASLAQLELILFLRSTRDCWWSTDRLNVEVKADGGWLHHALLDLCACGLAEQSAGAGSEFRYRPAVAELDNVVEMLARDYQLYPVRIIELIYKNPPRGVRAFADAFDFRKGDRHG